MNKKKKAIDSVELASRILGLSEILVKFKPERVFYILKSTQFLMINTILFTLMKNG